MSRVQLALRVADLEGSVAFYSTLFGVEPAKRRPGYANFAVEQPPLKLVLLEGQPDQPTVMDHLGVEVFTEEDVKAASGRLAGDVELDILRANRGKGAGGQQAGGEEGLQFHAWVFEWTEEVKKRANLGTVRGTFVP